MAETVQFYLEQMVPELEDFEQKGLFTKAEIKAIVKKRTNFEYALKRRIAKKIDFLRYIEYEMNLEALRKKRKARLANPDEIPKNSISEYAIKRRIYFLFKRAVNKFKGDLSLWLQYIEYAKQTHANSLLKSIFGSALQYHPRKSLLWILAASWEYETNANISAARVLMQRGLRLNPQDENLWHEYFRLELLYIEKIKIRRRVLGIDAKSLSANESEKEMEVEDENTIQLPTITGEEIENWNEESEERKTVHKLEASTAAALEDGANPILNGLLAKIIYDNAIQAIPNNLDFRTKFVSIYRLFTDTEEGCENVYQSIRRDMGNVPAARAYLASRHLFVKKQDNDTSHYIEISDPAFVAAIKACVDEFDTAIQDLPVANMYERYINFLREWQEAVTEDNLKLYLEEVMERTFKSSRENDIYSEDLYSLHIEQLLAANQSEQASALANEAIEKFPESPRLWVQRISLAPTDEETSKLYRKALERNPESFEIWDSYNAHLQQRWDKKALSADEMHKLYMDACERISMLLPSLTVSTKERDLSKDLILSSYVRWSLDAGGIASARTTYRKIIQNFYPTYAFYKTCLEIEREHGDEKNDHIEYVYEMASRLPNHKEEIYRLYITHLREQKKFTKADHVLWKATKDVPGFEIIKS